MPSYRERRARTARERYAGGRPNDEARAIHRRFVTGRVPRLLPIAAVLDVRGRRSGAVVHVPLVVVPHGWRWYTVSMLGRSANWVLNVHAADGEAVLLHGRRRPVRLVEVPLALRARVIRRYLLFALGARPHMTVTWRSSLREIADVAAQHPTFRIDPA